MTVALTANIARPISSALSTAFAMDNVGKLDAYGKLGATWSPLSLFANGEQGVFFDPSDLSTMFQDATGTTPVTADGQPVGLILDKSQGLVLGPELVTNGDFSNGSTGWTPAGSWAIAGGVATNSGAVANENLLQNITTQIGKTYLLTFTLLAVTGPGVNNFVSGSYSGAITNPGTYSCYLKATSSSALAIIALAGATATVDNISVRELAGNHALAPNSSSRPLKTSTGTSQWINYDAVDDVLNTTFPSALGSNCTVARANVGAAPTILTGQTIGTSYADSTDNAGLIIIDRALTGQETADVTAWLTAKGATS